MNHETHETSRKKTSRETHAKILNHEHRLPALILSAKNGGIHYVQWAMALLDEIQGVLRRPKFGITPRQEIIFMRELSDLLEIVIPQEKVTVIINDPDDDTVLECALAANADMIVSGAHHLLDLGVWQKIDIVTPAIAIQLLGKR